MVLVGEVCNEGNVNKKDECKKEPYANENYDQEESNGNETEGLSFGRGSLRARSWNSSSLQHRFRGRGFGNFEPGLMRGRGGPPAFMRGRAAPLSGRFPFGNNDSNWSGQQNAPNANFCGQGNFPIELWVETKTDEGKSYFYHAISRETTWTRPEGSNVKVMTQSEVESINAKNQESLTKESDKINLSSPKQTPTTKSEIDDLEKSTDKLEPQVFNKSETNQIIMPQQQQYFPPAPPHFQSPQYGMPPPGYSGYSAAPWAVPWASHTQDQPAKTLVIKPGIIDPAIIGKAAEWSEHRAPDGRPYYYHSGRGESVWEKPQAIRDLEAARMAAHSGVTPQTVTTQSLTANIGSILPVQSNQIFDPLSFTVKPQQLDTSITKTEDKENDDNKNAEKEKLKKEDEEIFKTPSKPLDKSRPISSTPIAGTPWCVVWTGDGRVFFYNPSTRTSVWERPEELNDRKDVDKAISTPPDNIAGTFEKEKKFAPQIEIIIEVKEEEKDYSDEIPAKKLKIAEETKPNEKKPSDVNKEAAIEAEVRASKERALVPLETRVKSFKEMLREKDVSAFSTWEKELHKIVFDQRYLLLTSRERKQVFEKYVKERAEEERKEKRNKMRQKRDDFRKLMETSAISGKTSFSEFCQKFGKDDRFRGIEKLRDRESLFNEFMIDVRRKEKEEKLHRKEQIRKDFIQMLRERADVDRQCRWADIRKKLDSDSRYRAVENSMLRENYFMDYCKIIKDERRRGREREREKREKKPEKPKVKSNGEHKSELESKDRRNKDMEEDTTEEEAEKKQKDRDRLIRAEHSIKEREKEVQRTLANHLRDRDKEREHHKRDEAVRHFNALLTDLVRNSDLTWKEVKRQLRKDHRWDLIEDLDREDREKIFNDHIDGLSRKKRDKFREMLEEIPTLNLTSSWKEIKKAIKEDPRYLKYSSSEKCEKEFKEYIKDKTVTAKTSLKELLQECKFITHKSYEQYQENQNHFKEIEDILKNDKRYLVLDHLPSERTQIILTYMEDLHKRGPPPPPTASESTRRK